MKKIFMIDASAIRESSCMRRLFWTVVQGYTQKCASNDMVYGSAFHKFAEELELTDGNVGKALIEAKKIYVPEHYYMKPKKQYMTVQHLVKTCMDYYLKEWMPEKEGTKDPVFKLSHVGGKPLVEQKFAIPWFACEYFDLLLTGTIDRLGRIGNNGVYVIRDFKTTSSWDTEDYLDGYRLDPQFSVYTLVIHKLAQQYPNSIYAEMVKSRLSYVIDGVFLKTEGATFIQSDVLWIKKDRLVLFEAMLNSLVARLAQQIILWMSAGEPTNWFTPPAEGELNGACKTVYGHCKFWDACAAPDQIATQHILRNNYKQRQYNPLEFGKNYE